MPRTRARFQPAQDLEAAHARHHQIEQDQVEIFDKQEIERACTIIDSDDLMALAREPAVQKIAISGDIVDDENAACKLAAVLMLPHINRHNRAQQSGDNLDRLFLFIRTRAWFDHRVDLQQQLIRRFADFVEIRQELRLSGIAHVLDQHFAIAFNGIERRAQVVPQTALKRLEAFLGLAYGVGLVDDSADERRQVRAGVAHAFQIGDCAVEAEAPRIFEDDIEKPPHGDNGGAKLLTQERAEGAFKTISLGNTLNFLVAHARAACHPFTGTFSPRLAEALRSCQSTARARSVLYRSRRILPRELSRDRQPSRARSSR